DRLELYALHKQSVSSDAPSKDPPDASVADKAKIAAWRNKRGMSQADAMQRYVEECDRQIRVYG
ncbi:acyl-coa binding protein, partial [Thalassiosira pseudonana CCMP1335]